MRNEEVGVPRCPVNGEWCSTCRIGKGNGTGGECARLAATVHAGRATLVGCAACGASLDDDNCDDAETHVCAPREK
jgi:hypothetical protein